MFGRSKDQAVRDQGGRTPLHYAAADGKADEVRRLLAEGADPDASDHEHSRPLHGAAIHQAAECLQLLLDAGAVVDAQDDKGNTALFYATTYSQGSGDCIQALRRAGADARVENRYGKSPLDAARLIANVDLMRWFADVGD